MHSFGPWGRAKRGDVRAAVLSVLAEEPMHGYQIIQQLEERSGGFWRPSAGSVYPTLQLLEDQSLVKSEEVHGKRVFSLTDEGRTEAEQVKERAGATPWGAARAWGDDPRFKLGQAFLQLGAAAKQIGMSGTKEQVDEVLKILADARKRIYQLLAEGE
jgi:DNA-binding PadR family transcriptional regulator